MRASIKQLIDTYGPVQLVTELPKDEATRAFKEGRLLRIDMFGGGIGDRSFTVRVARDSYGDYSIAFAKRLPELEDSDDTWDSYNDVLLEFGLSR